jgi:peptidoglycan/xylan/chitin deacetylase (PgdA/CDA1 family)
MTPKMLRELKAGTVSSWYNRDVITVLEKENVPATLFLTGMWIETYATTTRELSQNPLFELANHSYSHSGFRPPCYGLSSMKESRDIPEITKTDALLKKYTTSYVKYFRFPGLCFDTEDVKTAQDLGYMVIGGDVHAGDGFQKDPSRIAKNVVTRVKPGSIVILHLNGGPDAPETAVALSDIISKLKAEGYSFLKVSDLIKEK